jgi:hypothetical protein
MTCEYPTDSPKSRPCPQVTNTRDSIDNTLREHVNCCIPYKWDGLYSNWLHVRYSLEMALNVDLHATCDNMHRTGNKCSSKAYVTNGF